MAPTIENSTREERLAYVRHRYPCIADCDQCGLCKLFHGQDAEHALAAMHSSAVSQDCVKCPRLSSGDLTTLPRAHDRSLRRERGNKHVRASHHG